jgi:FecR protein
MRRIQSLRITALAAALSAIYPLQAFANAGIAQFAVGDVAVQRTSGSTNLSSGARLESGDTVTTGSTGRTQLRFTDGGMVSLQPNSQFKLTRYADSATGGGQDSFLVDLARGGMRAITGLIGKRNRDNYKVTTTTATIGIRGSGFSMAYNPDGTLGVTTELDAIEVCTQAGCVGLNVGESVVVTDASSLPRRTFVRATWNAPNPNRKVTARNDDVDAQGKTVTLQVDTGLAFTAAGLTEGDPDNRLYLNGALVSAEGSSTILGYLSRNNERGSGGTIEVQHSQGSLATGDQMILGTWTSPVWSDSSTAINKSGFVAGVPTPESALRSVGDVRGRYDLYRGTPIYGASGSTGELLSTSHLLVDFRSAFAAIDANLNVFMPYATRSNSAPAGQLIEDEPTGTYYDLRGSAIAVNSGFTGKLAIYSSDGMHNGSEYTMMMSDYGTGQFQGFFGGPQADNVGLSFSGNTYAHGKIAGAGMFYKKSTESMPTNNVDLSYSGPYSTQLHALDGSDQFSALGSSVSNETPYPYTVSPEPSLGNNVFKPGYSCCSSGAAGSAIFSGTQLRSWDGGGPFSAESNTLGKLSADPVPQGATVLQYGAYGQPSDYDFLGWGAWQSAVVQKDGINSGSAQTLNHVHYIFGKPTYSYDGWQGSANYSFIGGTNPTATSSSGTTIVGSIGTDSNLVINFASIPTVDANLKLSFNGTPVNISQTGTVLGSYGRSGQIVSTGPVANGQFSGILSGSNVERAGIVYGKNDASLGVIRGAAAFQTATPPTSRYYD